MCRYDFFIVFTKAALCSLINKQQDWTGGLCTVLGLISKVKKRPRPRQSWHRDWEWPVLNSGSSRERQHNLLEDFIFSSVKCLYRFSEKVLLAHIFLFFASFVSLRPWDKSSNLIRSFYFFKPLWPNESSLWVLGRSICLYIKLYILRPSFDTKIITLQFVKTGTSSNRSLPNSNQQHYI